MEKTVSVQGENKKVIAIFFRYGCKRSRRVWGKEKQGSGAGSSEMH